MGQRDLLGFFFFFLNLIQPSHDPVPSLLPVIRTTLSRITAPMRYLRGPVTGPSVPANPNAAFVTTVPRGTANAEMPLVWGTLERIVTLEVNFAGTDLPQPGFVRTGGGFTS